jgi:hypothetical protein
VFVITTVRPSGKGTRSGRQELTPGSAFPGVGEALHFHSL